MKKILFLIDTLGGGGAEKVLVNLVNNIDKDKYDITVMTMFKNGVNAEFLNDDVKLICRKAPFFKGISKVISFIPDRLLYKYFIGKRKFDVLVAYIHGAPAKVISGCPDKNIKKFAWLHTAEMENGTIWKFYRTREETVNSYSRFDNVVAISETAKGAFNRYSHLDDKIIVRYNTNDVARIKELASEKYEFNSDKFHICTLGRLAGEKAYDSLIRIASRLKNEGIYFDVHILGEGSERNNLEEMITELDVSDTVFLDGYTENPYRILARSNLFVCSSTVEGMSTAMSEAVILEVPVVSTDVSGAREVLGDSGYGVVTPIDEDALYEAIKKMISDKNYYNHYSRKVRERAEFFDTKTTVKAVTDLFD